MLEQNWHSLALEEEGERFSLVDHEFSQSLATWPAYLSNAWVSVRFVTLFVSPNCPLRELEPMFNRIR